MPTESPDLANAAVNDVASSADTDTTKAEIMEDLRQALRETLAGNLRPAREALDKLDSEMSKSADLSSGPTNVSKTIRASQKEISPSKR